MLGLNTQSPEFAKFQKCYPKPPEFTAADPPEGKSPAKWYKRGPNQRPEIGVQLLESVNRAKLIEMQPDRSVSTHANCISILAWGGMRDSNRDHLFGKRDEGWLDVAESVRAGKLTRAKAFDEFSILRRNGGAMLGMGPAYFTKLIYFFCSFQGTAFAFRIDTLTRLTRMSGAIPESMGCR
ncbi:8-oxoguanine DNA glycosylase OGG fold protein [Rhodopila globiformis]|uniref:8-oxoguanine DNA glycosylase OGG fold protein n=1 Tax=Rhodopila globiformis TaxID=1071 RepID=UPI0011B0D7C8|nr:hypothetical protein [Rhodopila globiformis]